MTDPTEFEILTAAMDRALATYAGREIGPSEMLNAADRYADWIRGRLRAAAVREAEAAAREREKVCSHRDGPFQCLNDAGHDGRHRYQSRKN